jgi:hypothetical protein
MMPPPSDMMAAPTRKNAKKSASGQVSRIMRRVTRIDRESKWVLQIDGKMSLHMERVSWLGYDERGGGVEPIHPSVGGRPMRDAHPSGQNYPVKLSFLQRRLIAGIAPEFTDRLKLSEQNQRVITLDLPEWTTIRRKVESATNPNAYDMRSRSLHQALESIQTVTEEASRNGYIPLSQRLYQFKITLRGVRPSIWRRIQVKNCTLDKLHEHIQTAMGWTNSHLHHFRIDGTYFGDPMLMEEDFDDMSYQDSTVTKIRDILPRGGKRFVFEYEYDFGDSWEHEILFEGCPRAEPGGRYPLCLEGGRACPPEDIGGVSGYRDFVESLEDQEHEEHEDSVNWIGGHFDPEEFDAMKVTRRMRRGLPNWRLIDDFDVAS